MSDDLDRALSGIPEGLRRPLIQAFAEMQNEFRAGEWRNAGVKAGHIAEITYCILHGRVTGTYADRPSKPGNMVDACRALEQHNKAHGRSVCIVIPKVLLAIYEMRN